MNEKDIPKTDSIQELAHFWDTHDLTDFEDQLETIKEPFFGNMVSGNLFAISFPGRLGRNSFLVMKKNLVRFAHN